MKKANPAYPAIPTRAARIVERVERGEAADAALREYFRAGERISPVTRWLVSRAVFATFRWWRWLEARASSESKVTQALELQERFDRNPQSFKAEGLAARAVPPWLAGEFDLTPDYLRQLQREPVLWIRPRAERAGRVATELGHCAPPALAANAFSDLDGEEDFLSPTAPADPTDGGMTSGATAREIVAPTAVKRNPRGRTGAAAETSVTARSPLARLPGLTALCYQGAQDLFQTPLFQEGAFEIQDLASQLVGLACAPKPGETWWDACAGEGGKTLHLSDLMRNKGLLWATDRSEGRLTVLRQRAARAGVFNYRAALWDGLRPAPMKTKFDGVLVDAPCSGAGTWQRNPHARWTVALDDVRELAGVQIGLLDRAAPSVKPGGRLIYAVCTVTRSETDAVVDAFAAAHPEFRPAPLPFPDATAKVKTDEEKDAAEANTVQPRRLLLRPERINANGMFIAAWEKS